MQATPLVAARKAKGKLPSPADDDPFVARVRRDLLVVEKALPRSGRIDIQEMQSHCSDCWSPGSTRFCTSKSRAIMH